MITGVDYAALSDLRKKALFTDVTVTIPGATAKNYSLHKLILASSSKFFADIFLKDPTLNKITLPNPAVPESARSGINEHIYTVLFDSLYSPMSIADFINEGLGAENCFSYFSLADSLRLESAKKIISSYISSNVANNSNSSSLLLDATKLQVPELIERCTNLLLQDFSRILSSKEQTEKLLRLPFDSFLKIVKEDNMVVESEDAVFDLVIKYIQMREAISKKPEGEKFIHSDPGSKPKPPEAPPAPVAPPVETAPPVEVPPPIAKEGEAPPPPIDPAAAKPPAEAPKPPVEAPKPPVEGEAPPPPVDTPAPKDPAADTPPPPIAPPALPVIDAAAIAEALMAMFPLNDEQKKELLLALRYKFITHEKIMKESKSPTLEKFKDILLEGLSAKLKNFEPNSLTVSINLNPRSHYTSPLSASMIGNSNMAPPGMFEGNRKSGPSLQGDPRLDKSHPSSQQNLGVSGPKPGPGAARANPTARDVEYTQAGQNRTIDSMQQHPGGMSGQPRLPHMTTGPHGMPLLANTSSGAPSGGFNVFDHFDSKFKNQNGTGYTGSNMHQHGNTLSREGLPIAFTQGDGYTSSEYYSSPEHGTQDGEIVFHFKYDFDENGALYYLGTRGKSTEYHNPYALSLVKVFFSSMGRGSYEDLVGRSLVNCRTLNEPGAFMGIDFGLDRNLIPTYYTIRNRDSSKHIMLNWVFEGSIDFKTWYILDKRILKSDDPSYNKIMEKERLMVERKAATSTWSVDQNYLKLASRSVAMNSRQFHGFRFFRIKQISKNSSGADNLALSGIEIYGIARGQGWHII